MSVCIWDGVINRWPSSHYCGGCEPNSGLLQEPYMFLTAEPSFQSQSAYFKMNSLVNLILFASYRDKDMDIAWALFSPLEIRWWGSANSELTDLTNNPNMHSIWAMIYTNRNL